MRRLTMVLGMAAALVLPPSLSLADDERERIEAAVVSALQGGETDTPLLAHSGVQVTAEEEGYRVRISGLETDLADGTTDILGDVSFRVQKVGDDYAFDEVSLPERLYGVLRPSELAPAEADFPDFEVDVGMSWESLSLSGLWSTELQLPIALDLKIADLLLEIERRPAPELGLMDQQSFETRIGRIDLLLETDRKGSTDWDSTLRVSVASVKGVWPDMTMGMLLAGHEQPGFPKVFLAEFASDRLSMTVEATGFNPRTYVRLTPALEGYLDALEAQDGEAVQDAREEALALDRIFEGLLITWRSRDLTYEEMWPGGLVYRESQDGRYVVEAPRGEDELRIAVIGEAEGDVKRRAGVGALYSLRNKLQGNPLSGAVLGILPFSVMAEALIPRRSSLSLVIDGVPLDETSSLLLTAFGYVATDIAQGGTATPVDLSELTPFDYQAWLAALDRAPTHIALERLSLSNAAYWLEGTADLFVDSDSASGVVGEAQLTLSDLDKAVQQVRDHVQGLFGLQQGEESVEGQLGAAIAMGVAMVKGLGEPKAEDGEIVYTYDFDVPVDQPATLNGRPLSNLFGP